MFRNLPIAFALALAACGGEAPTPPMTPNETGSEVAVEARDTEADDGAVITTLDAIARRAVVLSLSMSPHDPAFVDAYFGPEALRDEALDDPLDLAEIRSAAEDLIGALDRIEEATVRKADLRRRLVAMITRIDLVAGVPFSFDEETQLLYDAVAPQYTAEDFRAVHAEIDALVGGDGPLAERVEAFREQFVIPADKLSAVFDAALAECRRRTVAKMQLPKGESFTVEYVNDKPWSGYNWYQGGSQSLIQVNTDLPIFIHRAVDLGCHEGYPGHHTYNALIERELVDVRGWIEFSLYPLFSPQSLIAEGSANYGITLAFPGEERLAYERDVLFPIAGIDASLATRYYELLDLLERLDHVDNQVARRYLDGEIDRETAERELVEFKLMSPQRARQRVDFIETYRGYVINYNLGRELVAEWIAREAPQRGGRWEAMSHLLSTPMAASDLATP